jgi:hypothetical protein
VIRIDPPRVVVDPYLEGIMNRRQQELPLVVVHAPERQPVPAGDRWNMRACGFNKGYVHAEGTYTREELFRLIGQLERMAASL